MVCMPPGSAKSTYASVLFPPWFMAQNPRMNLIGASHTATLAEDFSRRILSTIREHSATLGYALTRENAELWDTSNGGTYKAAGVGGPITGRRADLAIIDDPVKSRQDAESDRMRDTTWNWFRADLLTRLKPGGRIVLIMTRWHEDDLGGRILETEGNRWRQLKLPALAEADDPLGREIGQPLWPEWESGDALADKRRTLGEREWGALFQQNPTPLSGGLFDADKIATAADLPNGTTVRAWDFAATEQVGGRNPDWTVGVKLRRTSEGKFIVLDVVRIQGRPEEVLALLLQTAEVDGRSVQIGLPQDPGQAGKWQVQDFTRRLAGWVVKASPESGDKATRAAPVAAQCNVGNLSMVRADWNRAFREELRGFPGATKDDQVDALSRAFGMLVMPMGVKMVKLHGF